MRFSRWRWLLALTLVLLLLLPAWWMLAMPGRSYAGPLPAPDPALRGRLEAHVRALCAGGPRFALHGQAHDRARNYIESELQAMGYRVERWAFEADGVEQCNLEAVLPGSSLGTVVVGAHYDTVSLSPGADDNASGVAALLELARALAGQHPTLTLRLVAFAHEESWQDMGSSVYAQQLREPVEGMLSLEMLGFYSDAEGSQNYPLAALGWLYPSRADFLGFVGDTGSRSLVRRCVGSFRQHGRLPSEGIAAPHALRDIGRSDHASFWAQGYSALMVTDTSNFRYAHYHQPTDTPDRLDYGRLALAVEGLTGVVQDLVSPAQP